jgi:hypothetical protein
MIEIDFTTIKLIIQLIFGKKISPGGKRCMTNFIPYTTTVSVLQISLVIAEQIDMGDYQESSCRKNPVLA